MKKALCLTALVFAAPAAAQEPDLRKSMVELPLKEVLHVEDVSLSLTPAPLTGLVRWHPSLESAEAAALESGRPILLFQLLGRLDEEFC